MACNLKALGLALFAAFAMSAAAASAASAQDVFTTANGTPAFLHGVQVGVGDNEFNTKSDHFPVTCEEATFASIGTVGNGAKEASVHPTYGGCSTTVGAATVDTTGCDFILTGTTDVHSKTGIGTETDATVSLKCSAGNSIKITVPSVNCTITMTAAENQNLIGVNYTNEAGSPSDVKVDVTVDGIHFTSSFGCQLGGLSATDEDAYLTETVTVKGFQGPLHGTQIGISSS